MRATYRLGRVTELKRGDDGLVRKVAREYRLPNGNCFRSVVRPIHGIAVIVPVKEQSNHELDPTVPEFVPLNNK